MSWAGYANPLEIEMDCIRWGGRWKMHNREWGMGLSFHMKEMQRLLWPKKDFHHWSDLMRSGFCEHRIVGVMGPASSGKTHEAALFALCYYFCFQDTCTVICSSTTREDLEDRVWGEIKNYFMLAKEQYDWLPGNFIESRQRIVTAKKDADTDARDFRSGMVGVACKKGGHFVGLGSFSGRKNEHVVLIADEGQFMPSAYVDAISNLNKNPDFHGVIMGNPKEPNDALGMICEPHAELGGWDGGIDQTGGTKTWKTRFPDGICIQLVGTDSPNFAAKSGQKAPFPYLIKPSDIESDLAYYGRDSLQYLMMDEGRMPRGVGLRRIITRQMCIKFGALEPPIWKGTPLHSIGFLDAAYGSVGGDRCVFGELRFGLGKGADGEDKQLLALIETLLVPVSAKEDELPEDQIAKWVMDQCGRRGIPPHDFFFDSTGRGSLMGAFARVWSPYVQGVEFGGGASERMVSNERRVLCCEYYSKFVTELWYSVRLCIEAGQFRGLTEDVMNEGCMREWTMVRGNKIEIEPKEKTKLRMGRSPDLFDALCFTQGTLISTQTGLIPIERLEIGNTVTTPMGDRRITALHHSFARELIEVRMSNGLVLTGTPNHPVLTNCGWIRLDALVIDIELESVDALPVWNYLNTSFTRVSNTGFKALVDIILAQKSSVERSDFFTELSGPICTDQSRRACAFTTEMGIGHGTIPTISALCGCPIIPPITCERTPRFYEDLLRKSHRLEELKPPSGMHLQKAGNGIELMPFGNGLGKNVQRNSVLFVERSSSLGLLDEAIIAVHDAEERTQGYDYVTSKRHASYADRNSSHIDMKEQSIVPVTVRRLRLPEKRRVYNLTVEHEHVYYANGVLVANCAGVEGARQRGFQIGNLSNLAATVQEEWLSKFAERFRALNRKGELNYAVG